MVGVGVVVVVGVAVVVVVGVGVAVVVVVGVGVGVVVVVADRNITTDGATMAGKTPTSRTTEALRNQGATVAIVEHWNPHVRIRQDMFGFIDVVALYPGRIVGIQCCARSGHAARRKKILASELAPR